MTCNLHKYVSSILENYIMIVKLDLQCESPYFHKLWHFYLRSLLGCHRARLRSLIALPLFDNTSASPIVSNLSPKTRRVSKMTHTCHKFVTYDTCDMHPCSHVHAISQVRRHLFPYSIEVEGAKTKTPPKTNTYKGLPITNTLLPQSISHGA
jgi:hypothetical protein